MSLSEAQMPRRGGSGMLLRGGLDLKAAHSEALASWSTGATSDFRNAWSCNRSSGESMK